jgi:hypothetical protein
MGALDDAVKKTQSLSGSLGSAIEGLAGGATSIAESLARTLGIVSATTEDTTRAMTDAGILPTKKATETRSMLGALSPASGKAITDELGSFGLTPGNMIAIVAIGILIYIFMRKR